MDKISIIIPIYNGESFIDSCLDSIVNQSYKDIEIILVNDGSKDLSLKKCYDWSNKDERVVVYNKKNTGVSDTRNLGIEKSTGKYVTFVDVDDCLKSNAIELLYNNIIFYNTDISVGGFSLVDENMNYINKVTPSKSSVISYNEFISDLLKEKKFIGSLWAKMYKKDLLNKHTLNNKYRICEDLDYLYSIINDSTKISYLSESVYLYKINKNSVTKTSDIDKYFDEFEVLENIIGSVPKKIKNIAICRYIRINIDLIWNNKNCKYFNVIKKNINSFSVFKILFANYFDVKNIIKYIIIICLY